VRLRYYILLILALLAVWYLLDAELVRECARAGYYSREHCAVHINR